MIDRIANRRAGLAILLSLALLPAAAGGAAAAKPSDKEVLEDVLALLGQEKASEALEKHGARLEALADTNAPAARILALVNFSAGKIDAAFRLIGKIRAQDATAAILTMADLYRAGKAYPSAMEKYEEALKSSPGNPEAEDMLKRFAAAGYDKWTLDAKHPLGAEELRVYRNAGPRSDEFSMPAWVLLVADGDVPRAVYELVKVSSKAVIVADGADDLFGGMSGVRGSQRAPGSNTQTSLRHSLGMAVGGEQLTLLYVDETKFDPAAFVERLKTEHVKHVRVMEAYIAASREFSKPKKDDAEMARKIGALADVLEPQYNGFHLTLANFYLALEARIPNTVAAFVALKRAADHLYGAAVAWGESAYLWSRESSLYLRIEANGLAWSRAQSVLQLRPKDQEAKEVMLLLMATGHESWDVERDVKLAGSLPAHIHIDLYRNKSVKTPASGVIVNRVELAMFNQDQFVGVVALATQDVGGKTVYFLDSLAWSKRETVRVYGKTGPTEQQFLADAADYIRTLI